MEFQNLSIYVHIPFCTKKCPYCHFYVVLDKEPLKDMLLTALIREWDVKKELCAARNIVSIYFGGGTPSLFGPDRIQKVIQMIRSSMTIDPLCEITIEANPEHITFDLMQAYQQAGINRASIGVQSLNDQELQILGRAHSSRKAEQAVEDTLRAGIFNISIDLMYEVPSQTLASWQETLRRAMQLPITHLSLYNLTFEPGTAFWKKAHLLQKMVPNEEEGAQMYTSARQILSEHHFKQYEISAFAKDSHIAKHNIGYWTGREFFGLGPSAFSFFAQKRFQNVCNLSRYAQALEKDLSCIDFEEPYHDDALRRELFTIALRVLDGIHLETFEKNYGALESSTHSCLQKLQELGLISCSDRVQLTEKGLYFYDTIASELI
jgi:oxygen-independent coproporphyrinogen-3 oxidase